MHMELLVLLIPRVSNTNGTIQLQADPPHGQTYNGTITSGIFTNNTNGGSFRFRATIDNTDYSLSSDCSTSFTNNIQLSNAYGETDFSGAVECSSSSSSSSSLTGSSQGMDRGSSSSSGSSNSTDSDRDGIPDSSDNCTHNSNHRCYKEGDTSNTTTSSTTQEQEQPSSSSNNRTGNQTR